MTSLSDGVWILRPPPPLFSSPRLVISNEHPMIEPNGLVNLALLQKSRQELLKQGGATVQFTLGFIQINVINVLTNILS